jgi:hypothetical protein
VLSLQCAKCFLDECARELFDVYLSAQGMPPS